MGNMVQEILGRLNTKSIWMPCYVLMAVLFCLTFAECALAQSKDATISGDVADAKGAVIEEGQAPLILPPKCPINFG
jgi:hypothetical protein